MSLLFFEGSAVYVDGCESGEILFGLEAPNILEALIGVCKKIEIEKGVYPLAIELHRNLENEK